MTFAGGFCLWDVCLFNLDEAGQYFQNGAEDWQAQHDYTFLVSLCKQDQNLFSRWSVATRCTGSKQAWHSDVSDHIHAALLAFLFIFPAVPIHCCLALLTGLCSGCAAGRELGGCQARAWHQHATRLPACAGTRASTAISSGPRTVQPCSSGQGAEQYKGAPMAAFSLLFVLWDYLFIYFSEDWVVWDFLSVLKWWALSFFSPWWLLHIQSLQMFQVCQR